MVMGKSGVWVILLVVIWAALGLPAVGAETQEGRISLHRSPVNGDRFSMEFRDADVKDVLRAIGQERRLNLVVSDDISGKLTLSFQQVTLAEAFEAILKMENLVKVPEGAITRVIQSPFTDGEGQLVTRMVAIQFAIAKELSEPIKGLLSKKGSLSADARTNTLIIRDVPESVERIAEIIKQLDSKTPQVMIEARIVEANTNFTRELGVQWGGRNTRPISDDRSISYGAGGTRESSTSSIDPLSGAIGISGKGFAVNLPAAVGPGKGGVFDLTYGTLSGSLGLDLQLSALEDRGQIKILSSPRILTLTNKEAKISTGTEIFVPNTTIVTGISSGGAPAGSGSTTSGVTTINAKLELTVTPHVTPDGQILLHVKTDKRDPDYSRSVQNLPPLNTRSAETDLLVKNGATIVIGGIYTRNESVAQSGLPWLSNIPVIGWLFKTRATVESQNELLVFITPTIYEGS
jgi:type IV pilus assembly protein PilQ